MSRNIRCLFFIAQRCRDGIETRELSIEYTLNTYALPPPFDIERRRLFAVTPATPSYAFTLDAEWRRQGAAAAAAAIRCYLPPC